jgi:hypothetical protein
VNPKIFYWIKISILYFEIFAHLGEEKISLTPCQKPEITHIVLCQNPNFSYECLIRGFTVHEIACLFSGTNWTDRFEYMYYRHSGSGFTWCVRSTTYIFVGDYAAITACRWEFSGPSTTWHTHYNSVNITALLRVDVVLSSLLSKNTKINIFPLVLCGCEAWSPTLWEEHKLMVFESGALMKICGCKGEKIAQGRTKLHNEDLHDLYTYQILLGW